ncbi:MAG: DUF1735 domain-containing protein [Bacteroidales bacterium]|nr:DUF1735 domain-containing protein [Bacteroidales bacterium]
MKKIILLSIAVIALAASCIEDSRNNFMVEDSLSLVFDEQVIPVSVYAGAQSITVLKSGMGTKSATVSLGVSSESLTSYNAENGTSFSELSASSYNFASETLEINAEALTGSVDIQWDPLKVYPTLDGSNSVIPIVIKEGSLEVNKKRNFVLVNLLNSEIGFAASGSSMVASDKPSVNSTVSVKISVDNAIPKDVVLTVETDPSLVAAYNAENGTAHIAAPKGFVEMPSEDITIKAGSNDCFFDLTLVNSAICPGGQLMDFGKILVPLKITAASQQGVKISDKVYYLVVKSPLAKADVSRVWGKFSKDAVWTSEYFPAEYQEKGGDRNLAVDANWVYLPYAIGGTVAKITAVSISDPSNTMDVNCTGFLNGVITTACVRMIDKGDGTLMLTAAGANTASFGFYSWVNGIDKAPRVDELQCTWRRSGDRYEFHGTWADGMLYSHSYQGTFSTRYEVKNGQFTKKERTLVNVPFSGFGGEYEYPGQNQMLFASSDTSALITPTGTIYQQADGQDTHDMAFEEFPAYKMAYGFRPFTFKEEKYIAYTAIDLNDDFEADGITPCTSKKRARLVIVEDKGGFKASLAPDEKVVVYEAPLQGENFMDMAIAEPKSAQGDCAVCVLGDRVIIAAGVQGIGVSVFKME